MSPKLINSQAMKKTPIVAAVIGNGFLAVIKFLGFIISGSGAMLSEAVHSLADTMNQALLLIGMVRAQREPNSTFQYGYGSERFIWALMSAVGVFFLGCGVTLYHGILGLIHPTHLSELRLAVCILLFSFLLEGVVFLLALRTLLKMAQGSPFLKFIREEAEPGVVAVLLEDAAACLGVLLALSGIGLTYWTGNTVWDALSSIIVGLVMGALAVLLVMRNHSALIGPSIPEHVRKQVVDIIRNNPSVEKIVDMRSRVIDSETYRIKADIKFNGRNFAKKLDSRIQAVYPQIQTYEQFKNFAIEYADAVIELLGDEIDIIEKAIQKDVPQAQFLDLEAD